MFFGPSIIILIPAMILAFYAQSKVSSTFRKYSNHRNVRGYTGAQVAEMMLRRSGISDVRVEHIRGNLTDHYDPRNKVLRLSDSVYNSQSVAAVGVAAHECGHAIQHNTGYAFLTIRNAIVPVVNLGSRLSMPLIILGLFAGQYFIQLGIYMFAAVVAFQLFTLPVEFNASSRALAILEGESYLSYDEMEPAKKVLSAAALTYVAAAAVAIANLLRLILIFGGRDD